MLFRTACAGAANARVHDRVDHRYHAFAGALWSGFSRLSNLENRGGASNLYHQSSIERQSNRIKTRLLRCLRACVANVERR